MWDAGRGGEPEAICRYYEGSRQRDAPRSPRPSGLRPGRSFTALPSSTISTYGLRRVPCIRSVLATTQHEPGYETGSADSPARSGRLQRLCQRVARFDIEQVGLLHREQRVAHGALFQVRQRFADLARDPLLPAIEEAQPGKPALHRQRLGQKIARRGTRRAVRAPDQIDQDRAVVRLVALDGGELSPCGRVALVFIQEGSEHLGSSALGFQQLVK